MNLKLLLCERSVSSSEWHMFRARKRLLKLSDRCLKHMLRLNRFVVKFASCRTTSGFYSGCDPRTKETIQKHCRLWPNFIEPAVEELFLQEIEPQIR